MSIENHIQQALDRLVIQYTESETVKDYLRAVMPEIQELENVFCDLQDKRFIDTAEGEQLNIIGELVGQSRIAGGQVLTDELYRIFIRARIIKNYTRATLEDIIQMIIFILQAEAVFIVEGDRSYQAQIAKNLTPQEIQLIQDTDLLPKPVGIRVSYLYFAPQVFFAYKSLSGAQLPNSDGWGTHNNPSLGGQWGQLIL